MNALKATFRANFFTASALAAAITSIAACDIARPFEGPGFQGGEVTTKAPGPFVAATTFLVINDDDAAQAAFDGHMSKLTALLKTTPGLVGSSLGFRPGSKEYRTLTVWETEDDMLTFVTSNAHSDAMQDMGDKVASGETTSWRITRAQMPPTWDDAKARLEKSGTTAY